MSKLTLEKIENDADLFLRLGLPSTLIRHENGAFKNALQTGAFGKRQLFGFVWKEKIWKTELFKNVDIRASREPLPAGSHVRSLSRHVRGFLRAFST